MKKIILITVLMTGLFFIGTGSGQAQTVAGNWKLSSLLVESDMAYPIVEPVTLNIDENGAISGNGGCHDFLGKYSFKQPKKKFRKPKKIKFSGIDVLKEGTVEDCPAASTTEEAFIKSLNSAATVVFKNEELVIQSKPIYVKTENRRLLIQNTMSFVRDNMVTLCDFRSMESEPCEVGNPDNNSEFYPLETSSEETERVMDYLFGKERSQDLKIERKFSGSFTKPNAKETLYYVVGCGKGEGVMEISPCPEDSRPNAGWIAIYDGEKMIQKIDIVLGERILFVTDINGDGKQEILSLGRTSMNGVTTLTGEIGQISGSGYQTVFPTGEDTFFGSSIQKDKCLELATRISYVPNRKDPGFTEEYFLTTDACQKKTWKKITKKMFEKYLDTNQ
jgi:hypothetical protein